MRHRPLVSAAALASVVLVLTACSPSTGSSSAAAAITIGTTDKVTALDPAGSWDNGSATLQNQVFAWLLTSKPGETNPSPDLAESAEFTSSTEYTVKLRPGLTFQNGHALTASDVKFSFDRQVAIADANGPSSLLSDLDSVRVDGDDTVVFKLKSADYTLWPQVLTSPASAIVDEEVFSANAITSDENIVAGKAFDGQYGISSYTFNSLVELTKNSKYDGLLGAAKTDTVLVKYYTDESNLKLDVQRNDVQVAYRTLSATNIDNLRDSDAVKIYTGPGAEMRFFAFNFETMPYGSKTDTPDEAKALAVRTAAADLIDRATIAEQVYQGTYTPLYTVVPSGLPESTPSYESLYGDGKGGPSLDAAKKALKDAGVKVPVELNLQYNSDHYGASASDEYALVKSQLEDSGLFTVNLQSTAWTLYVKQFATTYPAYQLGWFADFPDSDNYLNLLYGTDESPSVLGTAIKNSDFNALVQKERTLDNGDERTAAIQQAQDVTARQIAIVPLLEGTQTVIAATSVTGIESTLDGSGRFRFGLLGSE